MSKYQSKYWKETKTIILSYFKISQYLSLKVAPLGGGKKKDVTVYLRLNTKVICLWVCLVSLFSPTLKNLLMSSSLPYPSRPAHIKFIPTSRWTLFFCLWKYYLQLLYISHSDLISGTHSFPHLQRTTVLICRGEALARVYWCHKPGGIT